METALTSNSGLSSSPTYNRQWYVVKSKPHAERQAAHVLEERGLGVYLPLWKRRRAFEPLFPGYFFLRIDCRTDEYLLSRAAPGVSYILNVEGVPMPIMDGLIDEIIRRLEMENDLDPSERFSSGDRVRVTAGPFRGLEAVFDRSLTPRGRCLVLLQILGRLTPVQVDSENITKMTA